MARSLGQASCLYQMGDPLTAEVKRVSSSAVSGRHAASLPWLHLIPFISAVAVHPFSSGPDTVPTALLPPYTLQRLLVLCGVKSHRILDSQNRLISLLLDNCYPVGASSAGSTPPAVAAAVKNAVIPCEDCTHRPPRRDPTARQPEEATCGTAGPSAWVVVHDGHGAAAGSPPPAVASSPTLEGGDHWSSPRRAVVMHTLAPFTVTLDDDDDDDDDDPNRNSTAPAAAPVPPVHCQCSSVDGGRRPMYTIVVQQPVWERVLFKVLGSDLRGQMITTRPLVRWAMAWKLYQGDIPLVIFIRGEGPPKGSQGHVRSRRVAKSGGNSLPRSWDGILYTASSLTLKQRVIFVGW